MDHYVIWDKSDRERKIQYHLNYMSNVFFFFKKLTENISIITSGGEWKVDEMGEDGEKVQTYSYKI